MPVHCIVGANSTIAKTLIEIYIGRGEGCHLIARSKESLEGFLEHDHMSFAEADVTNIHHLQDAINACEDDFASLVYFPGSIALKDLSKITLEDAQDTMALNTFGALFSVQAAQQKLKSARGAVVLISSVAANKGFMKHALISMCKAALQGLTVSLAKDLSPEIRVNCIAPSLTKSKLSQFITSNEKFEHALSNAHPLKRLGDPKDIAEAIAFFSSQASAWITGQIIGVDGGRSTLD